MPFFSCSQVLLGDQPLSADETALELPINRQLIQRRDMGAKIFLAIRPTQEPGAVIDPKRARNGH